MEKRDDSRSETPETNPPLQTDNGSAEIMEEAPPGQNQRRQGLSVHVSPRAMDETRNDEFVRVDMPSTQSPSPRRISFSPCPSPGPSSSRNRPNFKALIPLLSFKNRNRTSEIEKAAHMALGCTTAEKLPISRNWSFTKVFMPRLKKPSSLPVTPIAHSNPESMHGRNQTEPASSSKQRPQKPMHRSLSVPAFNNEDGSVRPSDSVRGVFRVVPNTPRGVEDSVKSYSSQTNATGVNDDGEHIAEEEAVCRICLVELSEGSDTFKLECMCKGELALGHQDCVMKWFTIKGNRTCDVCKQDVRNLPVTLQRVQNSAGRNRSSMPEASQYSVWQDVPILVIVSMLAYFCFLEQLLVPKMKSGAIAIALPFSCILGLLASMTSTTMVKKSYVWIYATFQFILVVFFAHLFYTLFHIQPILSILVATLAGFGAMMIGTSIVAEMLKWRRAHATQSNQSQNQDQSSNSPATPADHSQTNHQSREVVEPRDGES